MEALFQHEILELQEYRLHVRIGGLRVLEYGADVRPRRGRRRNNALMYDSGPFTCWNNASMYDCRAADAGISPRCTGQRSSHAEKCPDVRSDTLPTLKSGPNVRLGGLPVLKGESDVRPGQARHRKFQIKEYRAIHESSWARCPKTQGAPNLRAAESQSAHHRWHFRGSCWTCFQLWLGSG